MPFSKMNIHEEIERKRQENPEFRRIWDESHKENEKRQPYTFSKYLRENCTEEEILRIKRNSAKMLRRDRRRWREHDRKVKQIYKKLGLNYPMEV